MEFSVEALQDMNVPTEEVNDIGRGSFGGGK